jgi:hypothetical protein
MFSTIPYTEYDVRASMMMLLCTQSIRASCRMQLSNIYSMQTHSSPAPCCTSFHRQFQRSKGLDPAFIELGPVHQPCRHRNLILQVAHTANNSTCRYHTAYAWLGTSYNSKLNLSYYLLYTSKWDPHFRNFCTWCSSHTDSTYLHAACRSKQALAMILSQDRKLDNCLPRDRRLSNLGCTLPMPILQSWRAHHLAVLRSCLLSPDVQSRVFVLGGVLFVGQPLIIEKVPCFWIALTDFGAPLCLLPKSFTTPPSLAKLIHAVIKDSQSLDKGFARLCPRKHMLPYGGDHGY